jgi:hypothetical protein
MSDDLETVWSGAGGRFSLSAMGPMVSTAARAAAQGEVVKEMRIQRSTRGFRAPGFRLRDLVFAKLPAPQPVRPLGLRAICDAMESTGQNDMEHISRALIDLIAEGKVRRQKQPINGQPRWVYWRVR